MLSKSRTAVVSAAAAALVLGSAGLASADNLVNDVVANVSDTITAGGSTTVAYKIAGTGGDGQAGCNASDGSPAYVTLSVPAGVSAAGSTLSSQSTLTFTACNVFQYVTFASSAVGSHPISHSVVDAGVGEYKNEADWTLKVLSSGASDTTAPEISYTVDPADPNGDNGWYTGDVTVTWHVSDESGIDEDSDCKDEDVDTLNYDTDGETFSCAATDIHGNSDTVTTGSIKRDATDPTITWDAGSPADGASYYFGDSIPSAGCTADDATSGVNADGCQVTGGGAAVGPHTLTAKATDKAGNETIETRNYTVLAWTMDGFYRPVDMGTGKLNTVKAGSTVPLKFNVFKGDERLTSGIGATFSAKKVNCESGAVEDMIEEIASTGKTELRYDADGQQWVQNWATPKSGAGSCFVVTMKTADDSTIKADFKLR
ncbi:MAG TPA: PxKF domain-containing protein [Nocardioidaceae bacterium]|nr:PxKF domain-containing protein [Nocardioidaceae bacterium]